jgi:predicted DNA-binding protein (MmcQ/YjbR family)
MPNAVRTVRAKLREFALGLPEAHEDLPWGERVVKVNNKVFVFLGRDMDTEQFGISVKLPTTKQAALRMPFTEPTGYGLGKSGWVSAKLNDKTQASFELLRDWVLESYYAVAPKTLAERLRGEREGAKAAKKAKLAERAPAQRRAKSRTREAKAKSVSLRLDAGTPRGTPKRKG